MMHTLAQCAIVFTGIAAVSLSQSSQFRVRRWASVLGLAGQPFWLYLTIRADLWGMAIVSGAYSFAWACGFYHHWIKTQERPS